MWQLDNIFTFSFGIGGNIITYPLGVNKTSKIFYYMLLVLCPCNLCLNNKKIIIYAN